MSRTGNTHRVRFAMWTLLLFFLGGVALASVPPSNDPVELLKQADSLRTSNYTESVAIVQRLGDGTIRLSSEQKLYLLYLQAWQIAYRGDYETAIPLLNKVANDSVEPNLRFRADVTAVNMLGIGHHYQTAFSQLDRLINQLPMVTDGSARLQGFVVAAQLYTEAGQYDLAESYADSLLRQIPTDEGLCKGSYLKLDAAYRSGAVSMIDQQFQNGIDACIKSGDSLWANGIRASMASFEMLHGEVDAALKLLRKNYPEVEHSRYRSLIARFNALMAKGYWQTGQVEQANKYALDAVSSSIKNEYTESLSESYGLLYQIAKQKCDIPAALDWHEKYMIADKGYLNDVSAKALAYQTVKQQVLAKKLQIDTLSKQNQILTLQKELNRKAAEASRLYIVLLLIALASIAMWTYRIKRSQLRFMKLARRDGLTGIFNRQHFVNEAELQLQYCRKSSRGACLVLIDLDHFKAVNDNHGHAVGDRVLKRAVDACESRLRSTDIFGRLGGEEFGILLPECTKEQAVARAEQIRHAIATASNDEDAIRVPISASFGIASVECSGYELRLLLIHADEALYQAKREGRNRVNVSDSLLETLKTA